MEGQCFGRKSPQNIGTWLQQQDRMHWGPFPGRLGVLLPSALLQGPRSPGIRGAGGVIQPTWGRQHDLRAGRAVVRVHPPEPWDPSTRSRPSPQQPSAPRPPHPTHPTRPRTLVLTRTAHCSRQPLMLHVMVFLRL